jgi:hypothetical protein
MYDNWYEEYEIQRRQAQETLERGLAQYALKRGIEEWEKSGALLNQEHVNKIRQWLPEDMLSEEAEQLLVESEAAFKTQQQQQTQQLQRAVLGSTVFLILLVIVGFGVLFMMEVKEADKIAEAVQRATAVASSVPLNDASKAENEVLITEKMALEEAVKETEPSPGYTKKIRLCVLSLYYWQSWRGNKHKWDIKIRLFC